MSNEPRKDPPGSDSEPEDVFHDARFPAAEEAVSAPPPPRQTPRHLDSSNRVYSVNSDSWKNPTR